MGLFIAIWMFVLGLLGAANLVIARKPEAKELIAKLTPYQGWIGAVSAIWGVWCIISTLLNLSVLMKASFLWFLTLLLTSLLLFGLGLLLGVGMLKTFIKQEQAVQKMDQLVLRLTPYQGIMGVVGMGLGIWCLIAGFVLI